MILAILFKIIPWWFGITFTATTVDMYSALSAMELFIEIVLLFDGAVVICQEYLDRKG